MPEYIITYDEFRATMAKAYEAGAAGREVYTARDYLTRPLVRCRDCRHNTPSACPLSMMDDDGYCSLGARKEEPCR